MVASPPVDACPASQGTIHRPLQPINPGSAKMDYVSMGYSDFCVHARKTGSRKSKAG